MMESLDQSRPEGAPTASVLLPASARSRVALGLTAAAALGRFELQVCRKCGAVQYPPREACHRCLSVLLDWKLQDGGGELISETTLFHSHDEFFRERLPLRLGMVRLDNGPTAIVYLHSEVPPAPARVKVDVRLDKASQAVLVAFPEGDTTKMTGSDMGGDRLLREITRDPKAGKVLATGATTAETAVGEKYALVTGGSSGIGAAICRSLLEHGYHVVSMSRRASEPVARLHEVQVDLTDALATREAAFDVASRFPITTVVHNAGAIREKPLEEVTLEELQSLTNLHLAAAMSLMQATLPTMKKQHYGRVVLVSTRAVLGLARRTVYAATKAGMLGLARTWALELGAHGITVNVVAPGPIEATEMFHDMIPVDSPKLARIVDSIPVKRLGRPEDVARAVMFFAAPDAGFVTGQTLFVCGGTSVGGIVY
jgi:3-oxoacyl-[acyl-carrier protein] reductase